MSFDMLNEGAEGIPAGGNRKGPDALPDGEFNLLVKTAVLKKPSATGMVVFQLGFECQDEGPVTGVKLEHAYFLFNGAKDGKPAERNDVAIGQLRADLKAVGFDEAEWSVKNSRPFADELVKACHVLAGMIVKVKKTTNGKYHNLRVLGRGVGDTKPAAIGAAELDAAAKAAAEDVPF